MAAIIVLLTHFSTNAGIARIVNEKRRFYFLKKYHRFLQCLEWKGF